MKGRAYAYTEICAPMPVLACVLVRKGAWFFGKAESVGYGWEESKATVAAICRPSVLVRLVEGS